MTGRSGCGATNTSPFAHPVEREIARLFDEHGIAWQYEPRTFVLERGERGEVLEAFTPDFYLPELDLYVECTVMRQAHTNRKRRKAQKARARAGVTVEVLFRGDIARLARRWRLERLAAALESKAAEVSTASGPGMAIAMGEPTSQLDDVEFRMEEDHPRPGTVVLALRGDADLHVAPDLRDRVAAVLADGAEVLVLDLSDTTFVDSMTLGVLLSAMKRLRGRGGQLHVVVSRADLRRIFEITLLDRVFPIHPSREEALVASAASDGS